MASTGCDDGSQPSRRCSKALSSAGPTLPVPARRGRVAAESFGSPATSCASAADHEELARVAPLRRTYPCVVRKKRRQERCSGWSAMRHIKEKKTEESSEKQRVREQMGQTSDGFFRLFLPMCFSFG